MRTLKHRIGALVAAVMLALSVICMVGCRGNDVISTEPITLPLQNKYELSWWVSWENTYCPDYETLADHPFFVRMQEDTNIEVSFTHPVATTGNAIGDYRSEWVTKIASDDMEDMVSHFWFVPDLDAGLSIDAFEEQGVYYMLNDYVDVQMPNFKAIMESSALIQKCLYTTAGNIMYIPSITGYEDNDKAPVTSGIVIRKDLLDEAQLEVPTLVSDWKGVLQTLKTSLNIATPFAFGDMALAPTITGDAFVTAYGQAYELYLDEDGNVAYGATQEGTYEYVKLFREFFELGLAGKFDNVNSELKASNDIAAWGGSTDDIANLKTVAADPNYELVAAPYPVLNEGDKIDIRANYMPIGNKEMGCVWVTQSCKRPDIACKWLDQFFTKESYMEASYGVAGEDYTDNGDGTVTFTDKIKNTEGGIRYGIEQNAYLGALYADRDVIVDYVYDENVKAAIEVWSQATSERNLIRSTSLILSNEEQEEVATLSNFWLIQTGRLRDFITGATELTEWDDFVASMNDGGLDIYVQIYQAAYERYLAA